MPKNTKRIPNIPLTVQGNTIEIKDTVKYLGILFDKKLTWEKHIRYITQKATNCSRALFPLLNRKSVLNIKNKIMLYRMCIRPILTYGCQAWFKRTAKTHVKKLQIVQNKNLKIIHNLNRRYSTKRMHDIYGHKQISTLMTDLTLAFSSRCQQSNYDIIRNLS